MWISLGEGRSEWCCWLEPRWIFAPFVAGARQIAYVYSVALLFFSASKSKICPDSHEIYYHGDKVPQNQVFANIRTHKRLDRFTLRGKIKVNIQWLLYCMVHNIEKITNYGFI